MANIDQFLQRNKDFAATGASRLHRLPGQHAGTQAGRGSRSPSCHTQCGTGFLADDKLRRGFADLIGSDDAALARQAVTDPEQTVRTDVELLRSATAVPDTVAVSGHVCDVTTGLVTTVLPAAPIHPRTSGLARQSAVAAP